jgi:hypothetical protein
MNLEIIWGNECVWLTFIIYCTQSDGAQLTLGTDVFDLRGGSPDSIVSYYVSGTLA